MQTPDLSEHPASLHSTISRRFLIQLHRAFLPREYHFTKNGRRLGDRSGEHDLWQRGQFEWEVQHYDHYKGKREEMGVDHFCYACHQFKGQHSRGCMYGERYPRYIEWVRAGLARHPDPHARRYFNS